MGRNDISAVAFGGNVLAFVLMGMFMESNQILHSVISGICGMALLFIGIHYHSKYIRTSE